MTSTALIVNPTAQLSAALAHQGPHSFKETFRWTEYIRPFDDDHPRMRIGKKGTFELVVIDVTSYVIAKDPIDLLEPKFPDWLRNDILGYCRDGFIVVVYPDHQVDGQHVFNAVINLFKKTSLPVVASYFFCLRDDENSDNRKRFAVEIHGVWSDWVNRGKPRSDEQSGGWLWGYLEDN